LDKAIAEYDQAIKLYPRFTEAYFNRGLAYRQKDNMKQALLDYTQAIQLDPKYIPAYANRGYAFYKLGYLDRALADFDKILEIDPTNAEAKKSKETLINMRVGGESPRN
jgi:tetratricopeptide (TPR) repeat protein